MDNSIPESAYSSPFFYSKSSAEDVIKVEHDYECENLESCIYCGKQSVVFNGHDYKYFLKHSCCYECYVQKIE